MSRQKDLAVKVMNFANKITGWGFQMEQGEGTYFVGTAFRDQKGQEMAVYYVIGEEKAQLTVHSPNCRYDDCYASERINEIPLDYPVYAVGRGNGFFINSPMPTKVLDKEIGTIVLRRMADMVGAMADIIG